MPGGVESEKGCGNVVVPAGHEGPTHTPVDKVEGEKGENQEKSQGHRKGRERIDSGNSSGSVGDGLPVLDNEPDGLRKANGGDGIVVSKELEGGDADEIPQDHGENSSGYDGGEPVHSVIQGKNGGGVGADGEVCRMAEGENTRKSCKERNAHGGDTVDHEENKNTFCVG